MFEEQAKAKKIDFIIEIQNKAEILINDSSRIKQIIVNLISNALKYTLKGSISILV